MFLELTEWNIKMGDSDGPIFVRKDLIFSLKQMPGYTIINGSLTVKESVDNIWGICGTIPY